MKTYLSLIGGAVLGVVLAVQLSADLVIPGLIGGALAGWLLIGRNSGEDIGAMDQDTDAGWYDGDNGGGGDD